MLNAADETRAQVLRHDAENKLQTGVAPQTRGWTIGAAALTLLYRLASNPDTAGDALKLLHELQVHQVELDLQHEQLEENRREIEQLAGHYAQLYALAPVAYFTVDRARRIVEGNLAAARMLGAERDDLEGCDIEKLVAPESGPALRALLNQALGGGQRNSCKVQASAGSRSLEVSAIAAPCGQRCLLVATVLSDAGKPAQQT